MLENNLRNISETKNGMGLSAQTFNKTTREELPWYPNKLKENDFQRRSYFSYWLSYWFLQQCNNDPFLSNIAIGDEASIAMSGGVNT